MSEDEARKLNDAVIRHDERLRQLETTLEAQTPKLDSIVNTLSTLSSYNIQVVSGMKKTLYGNGTPGLVKDMTEIKTNIENMLKIIEERKQTHNKEIGRVHQFMCWGGVTVFGILVSTIGWLIPTLIKYMLGK